MAIKQWQIDLEVKNVGSKSPYYGQQTPAPKPGGQAKQPAVSSKQTPLRTEQRPGVSSRYSPDNILANQPNPFTPPALREIQEILSRVGQAEQNVDTITQTFADATKRQTGVSSRYSPDNILATAKDQTRSASWKVPEAMSNVNYGTKADLGKLDFGKAVSPTKTLGEKGAAMFAFGNYMTPNLTVSPQSKEEAIQATPKTLGGMLGDTYVYTNENEYRKKVAFSVTNGYYTEPKQNASGDWVTHLAVDIFPSYLKGEGSHLHGETRSAFDVVSISDGEVVFAGDTGNAYGNLVVIQDTTRSGTYYYYSHQKDLPVATGDRVVEGQALGKFGKTGGPNVTGEHLHFEVRIGIYDEVSNRVAGASPDPFSPGMEYVGTQLQKWYGLE